MVEHDYFATARSRNLFLVSHRVCMVTQCFWCMYYELQ